MADLQELPESCYSPRLARELRPGDVCVSVAVPDTNDLSDVYDISDSEPPALALKACWMRVIVLLVFEGLAVVAPIMTVEDAGGHSDFETVVEAARNSRNWIRLPPLEDEWEKAAVAYLFMPHTVPARVLMDRRASALTAAAREIFVERVSAAFRPG